MRLLLAYLLMAVLLTWPLAQHMGEATVGFPGVDAQDTATLRGLIADWVASPTFADGAAVSRGVYWPVGYPVFQLTPNLLDHLSGALLALILPFPWSDNLWWLGVLTLNGVAAHLLGRRVGGTEGAGWLAGLSFLVSEPLMREANLHHAPQAMMFWAPLFLDALLRLRVEPGRRVALLAGLWLAGAALSYWYMGLFLALGALPLLLVGPSSAPSRPPLRLVILVFATAGLLVAPFLLPLLLGFAEGPVTSGGRIPPPVGLPDSYALIPETERFVALHGNDPLFWLRQVPLDTANRVSLALLAAALVAGRVAVPDRAARRGLWGMAGLGALMLLGPWLRWGEELVSASGSGVSLPFRWFGDLHPWLDRLTWPERWGMLVPLALVALAASVPRPRVWVGLVVLESLLLSGNIPVQTTSVRHERCWAALSGTSGAVLELPLARDALLASRPGVHRRFYNRPLVNPLLLPPGARPPEAWRAWTRASPMLQYLEALERGRWPDAPGADAIRALRADGVTVIAVDAEPDAALTDAKVTRYKAGLSRHLGPPVDLGCALVWWLDTEQPPPEGLDDGDAWREAARAWTKANPAPTLDTLMAPEGPERSP